ncbi:MAG: phosphoribosyltransferase [Candidatus Blackburnbacteria bacterium]|nr:phosphoribosyltransferase [Candidatus Blackburnbacteria bacterium]
MLFTDRFEAGRRLAEKLLFLESQNPIVLALPRGGVPVGYEIAEALNAPLDVLVVRKIGAPGHREFGVGAIAPENIKILGGKVVDVLGISPKMIKQVETEERQELKRRLRVYRGTGVYPDFSDKTVILVDDGLATGVTASAAIKFVLKHDPKKLVVAIPVCASDPMPSIQTLLRPERDEVVCLFSVYDLGAVGWWYRSFAPVTDEEVIFLLKRAKKLTGRRETTRS